MRSTTVFVLVVAAGSCRTGAAPRPPEPVATAPVAAPTAAPAAPATAGAALKEAPAMAWWRDSMTSRDQRIGWWRQARFGMFIHWGAYSDLGGVWEGQPVKGYAEHIQRMRKIPMAVYRERVVAPFNPTGFDADEWVRAAKRAGMGYMIITAKHHDGFAMYDSEVSDYDIVQATRWKRDPMRALKDASDRHGIRFGFYYSHAFDWGDRFGPGNDWEWDNPGGDKLLHGGATWYDASPARLPQVRRYVDEKSIPQVRELIRKYDPAILWFDTPHKLPVEDNLRILRAAREAKADLVVNGRIAQPVPGGPVARFGDYASTVDKPAEFPPHDGDWEAIPTTNESYGWHRMDGSHKPPEHFIQLLAKAAARGGNVLLNVGPMGNGKIDPRDLKILDAVGAWMQANGESIHGTTRTPLPVQAWGESTRKGNTLYLHVFQWPRGNRLVVGGLTTPARRAWLLATPKAAPLSVDRAGPQDLIIDLPAPRAGAAPSPDTVVALELEGEPVTEAVRLVGTSVPVDTLRAFDGRLQGRGLKFGSGKTRDAWVHGWSDAGASVRWPLRAREKVTFEVLVSYDAPATSAGGTFAVKLGATTLPGTVAETPAAPVSLGKVTIEPGSHELVVEPTRIQGAELMKLRAVVLRPM